MNAQALLLLWSRYWFGGAVVVSILCLVVTEFSPDMVGRWRHLRTLGLAGENTFGAWWSGTLLLLGALHSLDGYFRHRGERHIASAWLAVAIVLLILSMDEVGSFHERIPHGMIGLAIITGGLGGASILIFWTQRHYKIAVGIALGFFLFTLAMVQDELMNHWSLWDGHLSTRQALEEGTEVAAMLIFIRIAMRNSAIGTRQSTAATPLFEGVDFFRMSAVVVGIIAAPAFAYFSATLPDHDRGHVSSWLACSGLVLAGLAALRRATRDTEARTWPLVGLCLVSWVGSAALLAFNPVRYPGMNHVVLVAVVAGVVIFWQAAAPWRQRDEYLLLSAACSSLAVMSWLNIDNLMLIFWAQGVIAALILYGAASSRAVRSVDRAPSPSLALADQSPALTVNTPAS